MNPSRWRNPPRGYTLIEIVIALVLLVIVMTVVSTTLHQYGKFLSMSRTTVLETELARAILESIARDIRNLVATQTVEEVAVDIGAMSASLGYELTEEEFALLTATETTDTSVTEESEVPESGEITGTTAGIYGTTEWIQIDTTRLPRGEQSGSKIWRPEASPLTDRVSPSKTVLYYLGDETTTLTDAEIAEAIAANRLTDSLGRALADGAARCGLFRRAMDRSVTELIVEEGSEFELELYDEPMAPEIAAVEFLYFDPQAGQEGTAGDWVESWDMDEIGYLPKAVQITLWLRRTTANRSISSANTTAAVSDPLVFSLIVAVPAFPAPPASVTDATTTEAASQ